MCRFSSEAGSSYCSSSVRSSSTRLTFGGSENSERPLDKISDGSKRGLRKPNKGRETTIKYARRIVKEVSETRALHHWHPVLLAAIDVHPLRARASKGKGERPLEDRRSAEERP